MGDFNIDLLKINTHNDINFCYNCLSLNFFAPYIVQLTRPICYSLIDNIFLNTIDYESYSGNLTIQLADHFFQFVILKDFFFDSHSKKQNIKERNFKNFNEREFKENLQNLDIANILKLEERDPNKSTQNFHNAINFILDEFAPYKKLNRYEAKLKKKPWINSEVQFLMWKRDKLFKKFSKLKDCNRKREIYSEYKEIRNDITLLKRNNKRKYYEIFLKKILKKLLPFGEASDLQLLLKKLIKIIFQY